MAERTRDPEWLTLAHRAAAGNEVALNHLLVALYGYVFEFLHRRFDRSPDSGDLARDLTQDVLVRVAVGIHGCRAASDTQLLAWVFQIARNVAISQIERYHRECAVLRFQAELEEAAIGVSLREWGITAGVTEAVERKAYEILRELREALPEETVVLLWRRLVEEDSWPEIAARLGTTESAAKRRFQRVQGTLRRRFLRRIEQLPEPERSQLRELLVP